MKITHAFDWGPALFVVLNVQSYSAPSGPRSSPMDDVALMEDWMLGAAQFSWLEGVLAASDHPFKFVCIHHPVGGNAATRFETLYGRSGPRAATVGEQRLVHEMMREFGVQIFFFGHDHVFLDDVVDSMVRWGNQSRCSALRMRYRSRVDQFLHSGREDLTFPKCELLTPPTGRSR